MKMLYDERAENPIEVGFYVLNVILVMAFLMMPVGTFIDSFKQEIDALAVSNPLSSWGDTELATYTRYIDYIYFFPSLFIVIVLIWGVRAVIRRHTYTTSQDQTYNNPDEF